MPVDEILNLNLITDNSDLDKLDKQAEKALAKLDKVQKQFERKGGIFSNIEKQTKALPKSFIQKQQKELLDRLVQSKSSVGKDFLAGGGGPADLARKNVFKELATQVEEQKGILKNILDSDLGAGRATKALSVLENPIGFFTSFLADAGPFVGVLAFTQLLPKIIDLLTQKGGIFDRTFNDTISTRLNELRERELEQQIKSGFTQLIITNKSGFTDPRQAFNTFEIANQNRDQLENIFKIRNTSGVN